MSNCKGKKRLRLVGVGFDSDDGHIRLTHGENFDVIMGSSQCHEYLQSLCMKIEEKLREQGKTLENISPEEFTKFISTFY